MFLKKLFKILLERTQSNKYIIKLIDSQKLFYGLIWNLRLLKLEMLKIYSIPNLINSFIISAKCFANLSILFIYKTNRRFCLYIYY